MLNYTRVKKIDTTDYTIGTMVDNCSFTGNSGKMLHHTASITTPRFNTKIRMSDKIISVSSKNYDFSWIATGNI